MNPYKKADEELRIINKKYINADSEFRDDVQTTFDELNSMDGTSVSYEKQKRFKRKYSAYKPNMSIIDIYILYLLGKSVLDIMDIAQIEILSHLDKHYTKCDNINVDSFNNFSKDGYDFCLEELKKKSEAPELRRIIAGEMGKPISYKDYREAKILQDMQAIKKEILIAKQQNRKLDVDSPEFQKLFDKLRNQWITLNGGKTSGYIEEVMERLFTIGFIQACKDNNVNKVVFMGVNDRKQTKMCNSLDGQEFLINGKNKFTRYYDSIQGEEERIVEGLAIGINAPPIGDHFHWCRSYLTTNRKMK